MSKTSSLLAHIHLAIEITTYAALAMRVTCTGLRHLVKLFKVDIRKKKKLRLPVVSACLWLSVVSLCYLYF